MSTVPNRPKIYHITHIRNLPRIVTSGRLWSDAKRLEMELPCEVVGMSSIKKRRLERLPVKCYPNTRVGDYVPFYFCPRSIMLYILHRANLPELTYHGGQGPIVHLVADLQATVEWAETNRRLWAFSDRNAGAGYANFFNDLNSLNQLDWAAVEANDFRDGDVKEGKQAEFLIHESLPWHLVKQIGVASAAMKGLVDEILGDSPYRPPVAVEKTWYY